MSAERLQQWTNWLTPLRLERWNHLRDRAGQEPISRETGARLLFTLAVNRNDEALNEIKERIAE